MYGWVPQQQNWSIDQNVRSDIDKKPGDVDEDVKDGQL